MDEGDAPAVLRILARFGAGEPALESDGRSAHVRVDSGPAALHAVLGELKESGIPLHDAGIRRPTLDDVFLKLTGRAATEQEPEPAGKQPANDEREVVP
ncbi:hypothetical protein [Specibacter cremeus]|uniref:hypothetical protein n=1 Tax=Specibacter cremeus TaxID=1629051 RepID=UPI0030B81AB8